MNKASRYARLEAMSWWSQPRVRNAAAVIVGCGALGNELAKNLALVGWGRIALIDFDVVELSNLAKAVFFRPSHVGASKAHVVADGVRSLNAETEVVAIQGRFEEAVGEGLVHRSDVLFGCVDNVAARVAMSRLAARTGRVHIDGGLGEWEGTVVAYAASHGPCYTCGLTRADITDLALRRSCPAYARRAASADGVSTTPILASLVGAEMAQLGLQWIHSTGVPGASSAFETGRQLRFDVRFHRLWNARRVRSVDCPQAHDPSSPIATLRPSWHATWASILDLCRTSLGSQVTMRASMPFRPDITGLSASRQIVGHEPWLSLSPEAMGLPPWVWLAATDGFSEVTVELDGCPDGLRSWNQRATL